jgi:hypothetical protein
MNFPVAPRAVKSGKIVTLSVTGVKPAPRSGEPVAFKMDGTSSVRTHAINAAGSSGPPHPKSSETLYHCDRASGFPTVRIPVAPDSEMKELIMGSDPRSMRRSRCQQMLHQQIGRIA